MSGYYESSTPAPLGGSGLQCPLGSFLFKPLENRLEGGCEVTTLAKSVVDGMLTSIALCPAFGFGHTVIHADITELPESADHLTSSSIFSI